MAHNGDRLHLLLASADLIYDPLWDLRVELTAPERELLRHPLVRRLHFVAHAGAARLTTAQTYSRLEHVVGVFCLVAHFCPADLPLRAAALLHDLGHLPLSHTLEGIGGYDHRAAGSSQLKDAALRDVLVSGGLDPDVVADLAFGQTPSLLDPSEPGLGVDHLDSFVRAGRVHGWLTTSAVELLRSMRVRQGRLDAPIEAGRQLALLMRNNASFHVHPANVGPVGMVRRLVRRLTGAAGPSVSDLSRQGDHELWKCLLDDDVTGTETRRLLDHPEDLAVAAVQHDEPPDLLELVRIPKMYLSQPTAASDAGINALLDGANRLPRRFAVGWREDMDQWAAAAGHRR